MTFLPWALVALLGVYVVILCLRIKDARDREDLIAKSILYEVTAFGVAARVRLSLKGIDVRCGSQMSQIPGRIATAWVNLSMQGRQFATMRIFWNVDDTPSVVIDAWREDGTKMIHPPTYALVSFDTAVQQLARCAQAVVAASAKENAEDTMPPNAT